MKIENINISELKPYERNPRINKEAVQFVANSIKEFGFKQPVVIDKNNIIIAGHTRYLASKKLKLKQVPCVYADDLNDEQVKAYRIADNSTAEVSQWDLDLLKLEIDEMPEIDFKADYGLDVAIEDVEEQAEIIEDEVPEINEKETIAQLGDIWQLGRHRLMCGDSTDAGSVSLLMNGVKAELTLTDPPYGVDIVKSNSVGGGGATKFKGSVGGGSIVPVNKYSKIIGDETTETAEKACKLCFEFSENQIFFGGNYFTDFLPPKACWCVWDKQNTGNFADVEMAWTSFDKGAKLYSWLWNGLSRKGDRKTELVSRVHPTQKPVGMLSEILKDFSKENENIIDLFGGSGAVLIACEQTNRTCYTMELSIEYVDVILQRYYNLTGDEPVLVSTDDPRTMSEIKESRGA